SAPSSPARSVGAHTADDRRLQLSDTDRARLRAQRNAPRAGPPDGPAARTGGTGDRAPGARLRLWSRRVSLRTASVHAVFTCTTRRHIAVVLSHSHLSN